MKQTHISCEFVEIIPDQLKDGVIYVSDRYKTAIHKCCCGCGEEVVTPISPVDWSIIIEGEAVTLYPSIGNWSYRCRSHYWIRKGKVVWAGEMSQFKIEKGRAREAASKAKHITYINGLKEAKAAAENTTFTKNHKKAKE